MKSDRSQRIDTVLRTLSDTTRRRVLYYLWEHGAATRSELVDVVTGWQATQGESGVATESDRNEVRITLHHQHIPKLLDAGLIRESEATDTVKLTDLPAWVQDCLDVVFETEMTIPTERELESWSYND